MPRSSAAEIVKVFPARSVGPQLRSATCSPPARGRGSCRPGGIAPDRESLTPWLGAGAACLGLGSQLVAGGRRRAPAAGSDHQRGPARRSTLIAQCRPPSTEAWAGDGAERRRVTLSIKPRRGGPLGLRGPRRGDAAPRPGQQPHPHRPLVRRVGGRRRVQRRPRPAPLLRACAPRWSTALVDNDVGRLVESLIEAGGVDTSHVCWRPFDGVGARRVSASTSPSAASGCARPAPCTTAGTLGGRVAAARRCRLGAAVRRRRRALAAHRGHLRRPVADHAPTCCSRPFRAAKAAGTVVSYDLNYRAGLWASRGGRDRAIEVNRALAPYVDVMLGNEEDFSAALGFAVDGVDDDLVRARPDELQGDDRPRGQHLSRTSRWLPPRCAGRRRPTATTGAPWPSPTARSTAPRRAPTWRSSIASGRRRLRLRPDLRPARGQAGGDVGVEYGAAHGALAMTTPGDTSMVSLDEVEAAMRARTVRAVRMREGS